MPSRRDPEADKNALEELGRRLRHARNRRGLSLTDMSTRSGLQRTYVADVERGERNPTYLTIARIAEALDLRPGDLFVEPPPSDERA
jgi:transcriptional regulator with XRE-family HTH domain